MSKRYLAIGDIHGCATALDALLENVNLTGNDVLITLGDYINRGPDSFAVIEKLSRLSNVCSLKSLRGNHELMLLAAKEDPGRFNTFLRVGGDRTLDSYRNAGFGADFPELIPESHWQFFEKQLLPFYETASHFFVHANAYPEIDLADQPDFMLYWEKWNNPPRHDSGKVMVCGHTSQKSGVPINNGSAVCIDTWAHGSGWLSCLDVTSGKIWQANELREKRILWLDELACE